MDCHADTEERIDLRPKMRKRRVGLGAKNQLYQSESKDVKEHLRCLHQPIYNGCCKSARAHCRCQRDEYIDPLV